MRPKRKENFEIFRNISIFCGVIVKQTELYRNKRPKYLEKFRIMSRHDSISWAHEQWQKMSVYDASHCADLTRSALFATKGQRYHIGITSDSFFTSRKHRVENSQCHSSLLKRQQYWGTNLTRCVVSMQRTSTSGCRMLPRFPFTRKVKISQGRFKFKSTRGG